MSEYDYDLVVIGSGPAGEKGATQAAYFGKKVAVVEREAHLGGACINTGTLPSKTLRETALYLSGLQQRALYGLQLEVRHNVSVPDLMCRQEPVIGGQNDRIRANLRRHEIDLLRGDARFVDAHTIELVAQTGTTRITADVVLIATGTSPFRPDYVPWGDPDIDDSDTILKLPELPKRLVILGGGVIGCEYGSMFAALGCQVTIVEGRDSVLGFLDVEINHLLCEQMKAIGVDIQLNRKVVDVARKDGVVHCVLDDGHDLPCERLLFAGGRSGNTATLALDKIGLQPDARGLLKVDEHYKVVGAQGRVYAAGDVIGFPALASVAMEQGRVAMCQAFELHFKEKVAADFPYGLYTIPEVSMIGESEESATKKGLDFEVGRARYRDNARGQIIGDANGMVKLLFNVSDKKLIGVHVIGERATELVHTGMAVMHFGGTIDDFITMVFNFPTLGELFKYAAYDGLGKLARRSAFATAARRRHLTRVPTPQSSVGLPDDVKACLFDLDGVLTDTASVHMAAWKALFDEELGNRNLSPPFSAEDYNDYVDGKPRDEGTRSFLESRKITASDDEVKAMGEKKNKLFLDKLRTGGVHVYPGSIAYLKAVRAAGLRTAVVSSSANCQEVCDEAKLTQYLEVRVDGKTIRDEHVAGKPAPDTFVLAAKKLGLDPGHAAIYEDALSGVEAGKAGRFVAVVGVDRLSKGTGEHAQALSKHGATKVVSDLAELLK